jgi:hypothetical protein
MVDVRGTASGISVSFFLGLRRLFNVHLLVVANDAVNNPDSVTSNDWMIMTNDLEFRKDAVVALFKELCQHLHVITGENHENGIVPLEPVCSTSFLNIFAVIIYTFKSCVSSAYLHVSY